MSEIIRTGFSVCPHDCPSTCALDVELLADGRIGRIHGAKDNSYTAGVICEKVARYGERLHHPDRLTQPLKRTGPKGSCQFTPISWDDALDITAEAMLAAEKTYGSESVWPYYYAGTMGLVMRDGINRLRYTKRYSEQYATICTTLAWTGYAAGIGTMMGVDPREMAKSDAIVIWGTNAVATQVNVMTHATRARKTRGTKIAAVDIYQNATMAQADLALCLRPGTDGALATAVMHILFRDGYADRAYLERFTDAPRALEQHVADKTPEWASAITGLSTAEIEAFAKLIGTTPNTYFRIGYGFARQRNGAHNVHAVTCIPAVTGAWQHEGGGALLSNSAIYGLNKSLIEGTDARDPEVRMLDMCRLGAILLGEKADLMGGPPVKALFIQNTNPMEVVPEQRLVRQGMAREDLFTCVHEQFMTSTAAMADIVLPATMFLEHDDIYQGGGHQHLQFAPKLVAPPGECRNNHDVLCALAHRLGAAHQGFEMTPREIIDWTLQNSNRGSLAELEANRWLDCQPSFEKAHFLSGFAWPDKKFRFKPIWSKVPNKTNHDWGEADNIPKLPGHWPVGEQPDAAHPFKLATSPARGFLNSTFNETGTSLKREGAPAAKIHPDDLAKLGITDGARIQMGNERGEILLTAESFDGLQPGVVIVEGLQPNSAFENGEGINTLTSAVQPAPYGGAAFHDNHVWIKPVDQR